MFMRYRGGGIGHKYMRAIEAVYENMSLERNHSKERGHRANHPEETTTDANDADDNADANSTQDKAEPTGHREGKRAQHTANGNDNEGGEGDDDEEDHLPSSDEASSSGTSDSDDLDSDGREGYEEIHRFGEL